MPNKVEIGKSKKRVPNGEEFCFFLQNNRKTEKKGSKIKKYLRNRISIRILRKMSTRCATVHRGNRD